LFKIDCSDPYKLKTIGIEKHKIDLSRKLICLDTTNQWFITLGFKSRNIEIYDVGTFKKEKIIRISGVNHIYFLEKQRAVTFSDKEIIFWDVRDFLNWK
jgi:hypothetical protein